MNAERINELVDKVPLSMILIAFLGYLGYDYYVFTTDTSSPLAIKKTEVATLKDSNTKLDVKLKQYREFVKTLDVKKSELRYLAQELQEVKGTLSETIDIPAFMKMTITEAKKTGLHVGSLKPGESRSKEYYAEQDFNLTFRGVFVQLVAFLDRLSNVSQIVRIEKFGIKSISSAQNKFVELEGEVEIKAYKYIGSKADNLGKQDEAGKSKGNEAKDSDSPGDGK